MTGSQDQYQGSTPTQQNEIAYIGNRKASQRIYDPKNGRYTDTMFLTPDEQRSTDTAQKSFADILPSLRDSMALNPQEQDKFVHALYDPQEARLTDDYNRTMGEAQGAANASGVMNSIGFENYRTNQLEKNYNQGKSDLYNQAYLQSYDLPNLKMQPIINALGTYDAAISAPQDRALALLNPSFQGSNASNAFALARTQIENQNEANRNQQKRSFLGSLF